ncbi:unnamed protein product, partial [Heterotrigona itama]
MSCLEETQSDCRCRYTLTLTSEIVHEQFSEMKDSFNRVPGIHEVDEEETDEEETCDQESKTRILQDVEQPADSIKSTVDEDSIYSNDSFCSDESDDESERTDTTSRSLVNESRLSPGIATCACNQKDGKRGEERFEDIVQRNEITDSACYRSSISEDYSVKIRQTKNRRKNMSFTDEEIRKIEWENQILLRKIMAQQKSKEKILRENIRPTRISSSAINRKRLQKKIENENI